jgi:RNA polymerase subunit RPABC4/transcription elongation factor Spt4
MFFFIGGIQPREVELDRSPRACPACGRFELSRKRVDHYLSLFFIPLLPVQKGVPFLSCRKCGAVFDERGDAIGGDRRAGAGRCAHCGRPLEPDFRYCPVCGKGV